MYYVLSAEEQQWIEDQSCRTNAWFEGETFQITSKSEAVLSWRDIKHHAHSSGAALDSASYLIPEALYICSRRGKRARFTPFEVLSLEGLIRKLKQQGGIHPLARRSCFQVRTTVIINSLESLERWLAQRQGPAHIVLDEGGGSILDYAYGYAGGRVLLMGGGGISWERVRLAIGYTDLRTFSSR